MGDNNDTMSPASQNVSISSCHLKSSKDLSVINFLAHIVNASRLIYYSAIYTANKLNHGNINENALPDIILKVKRSNGKCQTNDNRIKRSIYINWACLIQSWFS